MAKLAEERAASQMAQENHSAANKARFNSEVSKKGTLQSFEVGNSVKLQNESRKKGQPHWHGPFEVFDSMSQNIYCLVEPSGSLFPHPVNGNQLQKARSKAEALTEPWALPPRLQVKAVAKDKIDKETVAKATKVKQLQKEVTNRIKIVGCFASEIAKASEPPSAPQLQAARCSLVKRDIERDALSGASQK